jgi:hypothetical protein
MGQPLEQAFGYLPHRPGTQRAARAHFVWDQHAGLFSGLLVAEQRFGPRGTGVKGGPAVALCADQPRVSEHAKVL